MRGTVAAVVLALCALGGRPAVAQIVRVGTVAGGAHLPAGLDEAGAAAVLELVPMPWLTLGARPTWARVSGSDAAGSFSSSGLTDLPLEAGIWHDIPGPLSAGLGASVDLTLPTGDTAQGLGSGQLSFGADVGGSFSPLPRLALGADVWRPLSGSSASTALSGPHATSLSLVASFDVTDRSSLHAGFTTDFGASDSLGTPRSLTAGFAVPVARHVSFTVDGAHGLTSAAPKWVLSVGIGSAFEGLNPVGLDSPIRRLAATLGRGINRGNGNGHVGGLGRGRSGTTP